MELRSEDWPYHRIWQESRELVFPLCLRVADQQAPSRISSQSTFHFSRSQAPGVSARVFAETESPDLPVSESISRTLLPPPPAASRLISPFFAKPTRQAAAEPPSAAPSPQTGAASDALLPALASSTAHSLSATYRTGSLEQVIRVQSALPLLLGWPRFWGTHELRASFRQNGELARDQKYGLGRKRPG